MVNRDLFLKLVDEWQCQGHYGYGDGAAQKTGLDMGRVCEEQCPFSGACLSVHQSSVDQRYPALARIRVAAIARAKTEGRPYQMGDFYKELQANNRAPCPDPWLVEIGRNVVRGAEGKPAKTEVD